MPLLLCPSLITAVPVCCLAMTLSPSLVSHSQVVWARAAGTDWVKSRALSGTKANIWYIPNHNIHSFFRSLILQSRRSWDQNPPTISADHITAGPPYTTVNCRRPSFSCRRCPHLERPAAPRHVRIISACFPKPSEDPRLPAFFPVTCSVPVKLLLSLLTLYSFIFTLLCNSWHIAAVTKWRQFWLTNVFEWTILFKNLSRHHHHHHHHQCKFVGRPLL